MKKRGNSREDVGLSKVASSVNVIKMRTVAVPEYICTTVSHSVPVKTSIVEECYDFIELSGGVVVPLQGIVS